MTFLSRKAPGRAEIIFNKGEAFFVNKKIFFLLFLNFFCRI